VCSTNTTLLMQKDIDILTSHGRKEKLNSWFKIRRYV